MMISIVFMTMVVSKINNNIIPNQSFILSGHLIIQDVGVQLDGELRQEKEVEYSIIGVANVQQQHTIIWNEWVS